jgi:hypothetical protein
MRESLAVILLRVFWFCTHLACYTGKSSSKSDSVHVGFVVDKVALGQVFPRVLRFSPLNFIPPVLYYKEK